MKTTFALIVILLVVAQLVLGDVYMHNPRGSNDRNCETNDNRNNENRLFNSQNNAAGGYACPRARGGPDTITPRMYYYVGSTLQIEWTNQHSCNSPNSQCEIVIQYMCQDVAPGLRDGTPNNANDDATERIDANTKDDPRYGSHETYEYYQKCQTRDRNRRLYIADRNIGSKAVNTRQNNGGTRYGWECPEERDYYPYWHPTPWKDIAVFTNNVTRCTFYQTQSQNVAEKGECWSKEKEYQQFNNENECIARGHEWTKVKPWNIPPPECLQSAYSRDNHLGNGVDGNFLNYNWTIPDDVHEACVIRLRYNISTGDVDWWADADLNGKNSPIIQDKIVDIGLKQPLQMALNTDQYGRTFQDRSYVFSIKKRPADIPENAKIWNLNIRGKRGNIVQTYPSVEYDFVPSYLVVNAKTDYVHIQWVGSDYNPDRQNNNGEGGPKDIVNNNAVRADRNNLIQLDWDADANVPRHVNQSSMFLTEEGKPDLALIAKLAFMDLPIEDTNRCLTQEQLLARNNNNAGEAEKDSLNCMKINGPTPYFDAGLIKMRASGTFYFFSSRNNNFSNRSQKGVMVVHSAPFSSASSLSVQILLMIACFILTLL